MKKEEKPDFNTLTFWGSVYAIDGKNHSHIEKMYSSDHLVKGCSGGYLRGGNLYITNWADNSLFLCRAR